MLLLLPMLAALLLRWFTVFHSSQTRVHSLQLRKLFLEESTMFNWYFYFLLFTNLFRFCFVLNKINRILFSPSTSTEKASSSSRRRTSPFSRSASRSHWIVLHSTSSVMIMNSWEIKNLLLVSLKEAFQTIE